MIKQERRSELDSSSVSKHPDPNKKHRLELVYTKTLIKSVGSISKDAMVNI
jgi:hypothetical protein